MLLSRNLFFLRLCEIARLSCFHFENLPYAYVNVSNATRCALLVCARFHTFYYISFTIPGRCVFVLNIFNILIKLTFFLFYSVEEVYNVRSSVLSSAKASIGNAWQHE